MAKTSPAPDSTPIVDLTAIRTTVTDGVGRITERGVDVIAATIYGMDDIPMEVRGEAMRMLHGHRDDIVGLTLEALGLAWQALAAGHREAAEDIILAGAKSDKLSRMTVARITGRAMRKLQRDAWTTRAVKGFLAFMAALASVAAAVAFDRVLDELPEAA
jgi:hypothetical protein